MSRILVLTVLVFSSRFASAQEAPAAFKGEGAALCVAAGEQLLSEPNADPAIREGVDAWRQILHVMDGTDAQRQAAIDKARASLAKANDGKKKRGPNLAAITWSVGCAARDMQLKYLLTHGSKERTDRNLAEEPGTAMDADAAIRLNKNALCLASSEHFAAESEWKAIAGRSRKEIDDAAGSAAGKALVLDYYRYLAKTAITGNRERFSSQRLQERCRE